MQAAILRVKLPHLGAWAAGRQANAEHYQRFLGETGIPVQIPMRRDYQTCHVWNQFVIRAPRRDDLRLHLANLGIGTEVYYPTPLHLQPCYSGLGYEEGMLPESEKACHEVLALPIYAGLSEEDIAYVVQSISSFYGA